MISESKSSKNFFYVCVLLLNAAGLVSRGFCANVSVYEWQKNTSTIGFCPLHYEETRMQNCEECVQFSCVLKSINMTQNNTYLFCRQSTSPTATTLENIEAKLSQVNSEADFRDFLHEHVQWMISFFAVKSIETCSNLFKSNVSGNLRLLFECYEKRGMLEKPICGCNYSEEAQKQIFFRKHFYVFILLGIISLIGNITVIFMEVNALIQKCSIAKEKTVYRVLVLNLSISDLLMGIYLTFYPLTFRFFKDISELCKFFGVISVLSSEISVTVLILICLYRWIGIAYPYKIIRLKVLKIVIVVMWIIWLIIALLPTLSVDFTFTNGIDFTNETIPDISFVKALKLFKRISSGSSNNNGSQIIPIFRKFANYKSQSLINTTLNHLGILKEYNFNYDSYYSYRRLCTINVFVKDPFPDRYYTLFILIYNFLAFIFVFIACIVIWKNVTKNVKQNGQTVDKQKLREDRKIYFRLFLIIATDFLCWIPICVTGFYYYFENLYTSDKSISEFTDCTKKRTKFYGMSTSFLFLLPINSLINPYLYSWHIWRKLLKKCKNFLWK